MGRGNQVRGDQSGLTGDRCPGDALISKASVVVLTCRGPSSTRRTTRGAGHAPRREPQPLQTADFSRCGRALDVSVRARDTTTVRKSSVCEFLIFTRSIIWGRRSYGAFVTLPDKRAMLPTPGRTSRSAGVFVFCCRHNAMSLAEGRRTSATTCRDLRAL